MGRSSTGILILTYLFGICANAQTLPANFSIEGRLFDTGGAAINSTADIRLEVLVNGDVNSCVFYRETHTLDLSSADPEAQGVFSLRIGTGTSVFQSPTLTTLGQLFSANQMDGDANGDGMVNASDAVCDNFSPAIGEHRLVRVSVRAPSGSGAFVALNPDTKITSVPGAMVADNAVTLQGRTPSQFIQTDTSGVQVLTQSNVATIFTNANYGKLTDLLSGTLPANGGVNAGSQRITNVATPTAAGDATNKSYVDGSIGGFTAQITGVGLGVGGGSTLVWDAVDNRWEVGTPSTLDATKLPLTGGTMSGAITMGGFDIYNTGHITMGNQRLMQLGTFNSAQETALTLGVADAGKIFYNTQTGSLRVWNGSTSYGVVTSVPVTSVAGKTGDVSLNILDINGAGTAALRDIGVSANQVLALDASSRIPAVDAGLLLNVNATRLQGRTVAAAVPTGDQVLRWNAGLVQWEPSTLSFVDTGITSISGDVVASGSGAVVATISTNAITNTKIADDQVTANKLKSTGIAINRLLITDASTGATIDYANCAQDQILKFNTSLGWGCASDVGVTSAVSYIGVGSGLVGGPITATGTLSVNTGVGANQIVQLDSSSRLPAVDGGLVTNSNAERLQGRAISSVAPNNLEVLNWNSSSAQWEPIAVPSAPVQSVNGKTGVVTINLADIAGAGDVTDVTAGNALLGGGASGNVTLAVNTGVGANQIMQLDSSSRAPGVDGGLMTNLNAARLQSLAVSATAPTDAQVLSWNAAASEWRAVAVPSAPVTSVNGKTGVVTVELADIIGAGDITQVVAGIGATGGGTAGVVTIGVDAGVGANQIVQLDASSRLPAVDGGLVTNLNAQRVQGRAISSAAPNNLEVLNWNASSALWEPIAIPSAPVQSVNGKTGVVTINLADIAGAGDVTEVTAGNALVGGGTSGNVTLAVNAGVGANQIMQLDSNSRAPGVDGGLMTNLNAVRLQSRAVSATAPTDSQVLSWNAAASEWRAVAIPSAPVTSVNGKTGIVTIDLADIAGAGDITQVVAGIGSTGGGTAGVVTVGVDAGVGANQIVQLDSSSRLPAVDGGLVTNSNAQRLQGRALSSVAPNNLEVLNWNSSSAQWEPIAVPSAPVQSVNGKTGVVTINLADIAGAGDVTEVTAGNALLGGGNSGNVTLAVNTGVGANQIMQLDSSSRAPGVDGGLMTNLNAVRLQSRAVSATAPSDAQVLSWNAVASEWRAVAIPSAPVTSVNGKTGVVTIELSDIAGAGDISQVVAGPGATGGGTNGVVTVGVNSGVGANQIMQLDSSSRAPNVDGGLMTNLNAVRLQSRTVSSAAPTANQVLLWNNGLNQWEPSSISFTDTGMTAISGDILASGSGSVVATISDNAISSRNLKSTGIAINRLLITDGVTGDSIDYASCAQDQVLKFNTSLGWGCAADSGIASAVTYLGAGTGLLGGPIAGVGTLSVNIGTGANQIVALDSSSRLPALDAGLLTNISAAKLQGQRVSSLTPTLNHVLKWNGSHWESAADLNTGTLTGVTAGLGLLGGGTSGNPTLSVNVGTGANQIVQLDSSSRLPTLDGGLLTNSNAQRLQGRGLASSAPTDGQVLRWNNTTTIWEPATPESAPVLSVNGKTGVVTIIMVAGNGILGTGGISAPTIAVDAGTGSNQIVQLDSSARIPAVDAGLLTNVNAVKLQSRRVSNAAPTTNYVLKWNGSQWEPAVDTDTNSGGTISAVTPGIGMLGGGTSGNVTVSVNIGTGANQIVALDSLARLPALDASSLTNVSASKLQGYRVSNGAPTTSHVLKWNGSQWESAADTSGMTAISGDIAASGSGSVVATIQNNAITSAKLKSTGIAVNRILMTDASTGTTVDYAACAQDQILKFNTTLGWGCSVDAGAAGVTGITSGTGLLGGPITSIGTLSVNVGTGNGQIPQIDSSGRLALGNGSQAAPTYSFNGDADNGMFRPNPNELGFATAGAERLRIDGTGNAAMPGALSVRRLYLNNGGWKASFGLVNDIFGGGTDDVAVQSVNGALRFYTGTDSIPEMHIEGNGSVAIGPSTPATGAILDVVGTGLAFSTMIIPRDTTALRPTIGINGMLRFNTTSNKFEGYQGAWQNLIGAPGVQTVTSGTGLTGGGTGVNVTLAVNVGTGNAQVPQLDSIGRMPIVDGFYMTNLNASRLANRVIANTAPSNGQVLQWNNATQVWEPATPSGGASNAFVNGGNAFVGAATIGTNNTEDLVLETDDTASVTIKPDGRMGVGTSNPTAIADFDGTGTGLSAIVLPRDTTTNRPVAGGGATNGMIRYNINLGKFEAFEAGAWKNVIDGSGAVSWPLQAPNGNVSAPSYNFSGSANSGMYYIALTALGFSYAGIEQMRIDSTGVIFQGNIGFKVTTAGTAPLTWAASAVQTTSSTCAGSPDFQIDGATMKEGGTYTLVNTDTTTTNICDFTVSSWSFRWVPANGPRTLNSHTIYNFTRIGGVVYVTWTTGFQ